MSDQTQKPKFCVKCKWHFSKEFEDGTSHLCIHPDSEADKQGVKFDLVTGEETDVFARFRACGTMRMLVLCGASAKLFEEK